MSSILERIGLGKQNDNYEDDFIYFWDDVEDSDFVSIERKTLVESIQDNIVLTLHLLMILPVLGLTFFVTTSNLWVGLFLGFLSGGLIFVSYFITRNEYVVPVKILEENFKEVQRNNLHGSNELLYSMEASEVLEDFNEMRQGFANFLKLYRDNTTRLKQEITLLQTMITSIYRNVDQVNLSIDNTSASNANYQQLRGNITQLSEGLDLYTENFDISFSSITEITNTLKSIGKQTTMLALNAGIEAAKAGGRGKGFEVVASNLRRMAQHAIDTANRVKVSSELVNDNARIALEEITSGTLRIEGIIDDNHRNISESNSDLYNSVNDINAVRTGYQRVLGIIEQQESELSKYKY